VRAPQRQEAIVSIFVFDAYGTLFDVHSAIARHRAAIGPDADRLSEIWRAKQLEYTWTLTLAGHYVDFWTLTESALDFALARVPAADAKFKSLYLDAYRVLDAFPDARLALRELKVRGLRTAILSNGTPAMLAAAVAAAGLEPKLDAVLSVDGLRMYKPRPEVYRFACDSLQAAPSDVVFISSNRWDVMGAQGVGLQAVWVNRARLPDEYGIASHTIADLVGVIALAEHA
jgi:2-haloacid dehalogenase